MQAKDLENPLMGYIVIAVALIVGTLAATVWGQNPLPPESTTGSAAVVFDQPAGEKNAAPAMPATHHQSASQRLQIGVPRTRPQDRWLLGVVAKPTDTGYVVQRTELGSAAEKLGLEPGDRLVSINGRQIGWVGRTLIPLRDVLQECGAGHGKVRLLVQDRRSARLVSLPVRLRSLGSHLGH